jgi:hypothetical protein
VTVTDDDRPLTREQLLAFMFRFSFRAQQREFFHRHIIEGTVFKNEWIEWVKPRSLTKPYKDGGYEQLVAYLDPSFKSGHIFNIVFLPKATRSYTIEEMNEGIAQGACHGGA